MWLIRLIVWLVSLAMIPVVMAFSVSNRGPVEVSLEPIPYVVEAPLYLVVLAAVGIGLVWGGLGAWTSGARSRRLARDRAYEASKAKREVSTLKDTVLNLEAAKAEADVQARTESA